jgi:hypothetical protein
MKLIFRTLLFHIFCIIFFALIYLSLSKHFLPLNEDIHRFNLDDYYKQVLDFFLLSTSIQTSIGLTNLYPVSSLAKSILMIHELVMVSTHLFTLYIFTL